MSTIAAMLSRYMWLIHITLLVALVAQTGCSRRRYRLAADCQAQDLIAEKGTMNPAWALRNWNVYGDPQSLL